MERYASGARVRYAVDHDSESGSLGPVSWSTYDAFVGWKGSPCAVERTGFSHSGNGSTIARQPSCFATIRDEQSAQDALDRSVHLSSMDRSPARRRIGVGAARVSVPAAPVRETKTILVCVPSDRNGQGADGNTRIAFAKQLRTHEFWRCDFRVGRTEQTLQLPERRTQVEMSLIV